MVDRFQIPGLADMVVQAPSFSEAYRLKADLLFSELLVAAACVPFAVYEVQTRRSDPPSSTPEITRMGEAAMQVEALG